MDENLDKRLAQSASLGRARRIDGVHDRYIEFAKRTLPRDLSLDGLRVVVDCANGAAYKVVPEALWELGADVISIGVEPDGFNINKDCGSTSPDALSRKVREMRADIGIALDGAPIASSSWTSAAMWSMAIAARRHRAELEGRWASGETGHRRHRDVESRP